MLLLLLLLLSTRAMTTMSGDGNHQCNNDIGMIVIKAFLLSKLVRAHTREKALVVSISR
jgi:hypothetical protein